jgi:hypothetical protein
MARPVPLTGPWQYKLSALHYKPAVTAMVANLAAEKQAKAAA